MNSWLATTIYTDFKGSMNDLYSVFTTQLLPALGQGVQITKDYVMDLFGRYIQYAIAMDIIMLIVYALLIAAAVRFFFRTRKKEESLRHDMAWAYRCMFFFMWFIPLILCVVGFCNRTQHLVQSIYIPEITVYEKIMDIKLQYECSNGTRTNKYDCN